MLFKKQTNGKIKPAIEKVTAETMDRLQAAIETIERATAFMCRITCEPLEAKRDTQSQERI